MISSTNSQIINTPAYGESPAGVKKRPSLNCEMNSTSTRSPLQREAENIFRTGQRFPRGRLGWTHFTHQKPAARDRRASTCPLHSRAQRPATSHPAEPSASPRRWRTPVPAHCGPSTVPRGPAGAGELPTPWEGRWVRAASELPGPAGHPGAPRPRREALSSRTPGGARRPSRGGTRDGQLGEAGGAHGAGSSEGALAPAAPAAPHLPSARFMPASAAHRGSAGPGPARHRFCFRRQSASSAAAAGPAEGEPEAARRSCSRATGSVRFLIPWPARPVSPAPPAAAEGSHRRGEPPQPPPRARRPDVPAGRRTRPQPVRAGQ